MKKTKRPVYTEKQISEVFIMSLEEAKENAIKTADTEKRISNTLKDFENKILNLKGISIEIDDKKLQETAQELYNSETRAAKRLTAILENIKSQNIEIDDSKVKETISNWNETIKKTKSEIKIFKYSNFAIIITLLLTCFNFWFFYKHTQTKIEIREEQLTELKQNGQLKTPEEDAFIKAYIKWEKKNPNDSYNFRTKIDKVK